MNWHQLGVVAAVVERTVAARLSLSVVELYEAASDAVDVYLTREGELRGELFDGAAIPDVWAKAAISWAVGTVWRVDLDLLELEGSRRV